MTHPESLLSGPFRDEAGLRRRSRGKENLMLNSKQRSYLRSLANPLPSLYQVGKGGIGETMFTQYDEALEARELIKGSVLKNSLYSAREAAEEIAAATGAEVVSVIGGKFTLYRRSKENQVIFLPR
jgi:RNA-binding protein